MVDRIVLIRGLARGNGHWAKFKETLSIQSPNLKVELLEIPGNGSRYQEITPMNIKVLIDDLRQRIFEKNKEKPIRLVGISLGGMVALKWAELFPEDLESVFTINSSLRQSSTLFERLLPHNYKNVFKSLFSLNAQTREKLILEMTVSNHAVVNKYRDLFTELSLRQPMKLQNFFRQLILANRIEICGPLQRPLTVIYSKGDTFVHPNCSIRIAEVFNGSLVVHPSAGHDLPLEDPDWLSSVILNGCPS